MTKLNQIIAVEKGVKNNAFETLTNAYQLLQKSALLGGIARSYTPKDDEGDRLPAESTKVQIRVDDVITSVETSLVRLFDLTLTKDLANSSAVADISVEGTVLATAVPVTTLLFLEKQLTDLSTFIRKLPVLDPAETWIHSDTADCYATPTTGSVRTKKVPKSFVRSEATPQHPAQVDLFHEDVIVGTWQTVKYSGALPTARVAEMSQRVAKLLTAVKFAREEANGTLVTDAKMGERIFSYILTGS